MSDKLGEHITMSCEVLRQNTSCRAYDVLRSNGAFAYS